MSESLTTKCVSWFIIAATLGIVAPLATKRLDHAETESCWRAEFETAEQRLWNTLTEERQWYRTDIQHKFFFKDDLLKFADQYHVNWCPGAEPQRNRETWRASSSSSSSSIRYLGTAGSTMTASAGTSGVGGIVTLVGGQWLRWAR